MEKTIKIPHVPFYFVRHGQTDWNKAGKYMGQADIPLNLTGLEQAQTVAKNIAHLEISKIISSPLKRTIQTAEIIAAVMNIPILVVDELKVCSCGVLEGQPKGDGKLYEDWKMGGAIEGAENLTDYIQRIATNVNSVLVNNSDEKPILFVNHGPMYWALLRILNATNVDIRAKNCGAYFFSPPNSERDQWTVHSVNDNC